MTDPDDEWVARRIAAIRYRKEHGFTGRVAAQPDDIDHGIRANCSCPRCREAHRERARRYRQNKKAS